jgi:hypothetical protein
MICAIMCNNVLISCYTQLQTIQEQKPVTNDDAVQLFETYLGLRHVISRLLHPHDSPRLPSDSTFTHGQKVITHCNISTARLVEKQQCCRLGAVLLQLPMQCHARAPSIQYLTLSVNCQYVMTLRCDRKFLHGEVMLNLKKIQKT